MVDPPLRVVLPACVILKEFGMDNEWKDRKRKREKRRTFIHWWREREGEREREIRTVRFGKTGRSKIDQKLYPKIDLKSI